MVLLLKLAATHIHYLLAPIAIFTSLYQATTRTVLQCTHTHTHMQADRQIRRQTRRQTPITHTHTPITHTQTHHTHTHTHTHTSRAHMHTHMHTCMYTRTHAYTHAHTCTHMPTYADRYTYGHTHSHTHMDTHTCTHIHIWTHTHAHTPVESTFLPRNALLSVYCTSAFQFFDYIIWTIIHFTETLQFKDHWPHLRVFVERYLTYITIYGSLATPTCLSGEMFNLYYNL